MIGIGEIRTLLLSPEDAIRELLADERPPSQLLSSHVVPLVSLRSIAVLLQSTLAGSFVVGLVLAVTNFALQLGVWLSVSLALRVLAKQFGAAMTDRQAFVLTMTASIPLWLAGIFYLVPPDPPVLFYWSRALVLLAGSFGALIFLRGLSVLDIEKRAQIVGTAALAYTLVYFVLFAALGLSSHVFLFMLGA